MDSTVPPLPCKHLPLCQSPWERPSGDPEPCPWLPGEDRPPQRLWEVSHQQYTQVPAAEDIVFVPLDDVKECRD